MQQRSCEIGGARRDRTADLLRARQALSQLSYGPKMVGLGRFELPTSPLSGVRSNRLSYRPKVSRCLNFVELRSRAVAWNQIICEGARAFICKGVFLTL